MPGSKEAGRNNLAHAGSDLIGRTAALQHLRDLVSAHRTVTLTGMGGIGKTRLALEVARSLLPDMEGDIAFVELASLFDSSLCRQPSQALSA